MRRHTGRCSHFSFYYHDRDSSCDRRLLRLSSTYCRQCFRPVHVWLAVIRLINSGVAASTTAALSSIYTKPERRRRNNSPPGSAFSVPAGMDFTLTAASNAAVGLLPPRSPLQLRS